MASRKRLRDWGPARGRSAEITAAITADPDPATRPPGRKDKRAWCRGKQGVPHQPAVVFRPGCQDGRIYMCEWASRPGEDGWAVRWLCWHCEACLRCGKVLREPWQIPPAECPGYPGSDEQRAAAEAESIAAGERWRAWRQGRRPVITGPQGYRRKRA